MPKRERSHYDKMKRKRANNERKRIYTDKCDICGEEIYSNYKISNVIYENEKTFCRDCYIKKQNDNKNE